jgi:hypothetical protein
MWRMAAAEALARLAAIWDKIEMVVGGMVQPVFEKMHLPPSVELRRERRSKPGGPAMRVRRQRYNMTTMFEDGPRTPKKAVDPPPARAYFMLRESAKGVLGGKNIINSYAP